MTTYTSETVTCTFRRWIIPAAVAACRAYRETHGLVEGAPIADDALRFHVRDVEIVIEFTVNGEPS